MEANRETTEYISHVELEKIYKETHDHEREMEECGLLVFRGGEKISGLTGYNTTQPFHDGRSYVIGVRMEKIDDELESRVEFFRADSAFSRQWDHDENLPNIPGQDPFITKINGRLVLNSVEVERTPASDGTPGHVKWKTAFYEGSRIDKLELFAHGPDMMKDIRLVQLPTKEIMIFTRPQHADLAKGGRGQIGVIATDSINTVRDPSALLDAPLINTRFLPEEWGGINYTVSLQDGKIGVIGHIARFDTDDPDYKEKEDKPKIYSPFSGIYDIATRKINDIEILAMANEFKGVTPKRDVLKDVAFGTGITDPNEDGEVMLFMGIGDAVTGCKMIKDPFAKLR